MLDEKNYTLETIPPKGELVLLKPTANLSTGGTSTDVTDEVHPDNVIMAERIARIVGLDICGIDIMAKELRSPVAEIGGAILEVNAAPGFRMHIEPSEGIARNVAEPVINMLFFLKVHKALFPLLPSPERMVKQLPRVLLRTSANQPEEKLDIPPATVSIFKIKC